MKHVPCFYLITVLILVIVTGNVRVIYAQSPEVTKSAQKTPLRPRQPGGYLNATLGTYLTIEGVLYEGNGKVESNTIVIDTVDGKKLEKTILIKVDNVRLPTKTRCILKGYELGRMVGRPPAEYALYKELGKNPAELAERDAVPWHWRPYFVPMIVVEPQGLKTTTNWGITK
ncbi:hypothetical protein [Gimesia aquarii]|uniref:Uncharacterized protein n=1 Tax=Gimesia aquarii TaxID=2527964 RepID=A0A517VWN2_9PLAN|nr:hypothetical protein [Gimesia aquarii]QDT97410.1 hypothetical protein V144x_28850 [Gimesia aquarii]